jgi:hypothetical protein
VPRPYQGQVVAIWRSGPAGLRLIYLQATTIPAESR